MKTQKIRSDVRELIVKKGTELFYREGFAQSSIRDIGRRAGISSATIYYYFKTKDYLLYEIIKTMGDHVLIMLDQTRRESDDPEVRLRQMIFRHICLVEEKKEQIKIYMEEQYQLPKGLKKIIYKQHRKVYETYLHELERLNETGRLQVSNLPIVNFFIFAAINWVYRWFKKEKVVPIDEVAKMIIDMLFKGILKCPLEPVPRELTEVVDS